MGVNGSLECVANGCVAEHTHHERPRGRDGVSGPLGKLGEVVDERRFQGGLRHVLRQCHAPRQQKDRDCDTRDMYDDEAAYSTHIRVMPARASETLESTPWTERISTTHSISNPGFPRTPRIRFKDEIMPV
jgi:hypothetical protein